MTETDDLIELIPDPDTLRHMIAASVRRTELLRGLIRLSYRKATYDQPAEDEPSPSATPAGKAVASA